MTKFGGFMLAWLAMSIIFGGLIMVGIGVFGLMKMLWEYDQNIAKNIFSLGGFLIATGLMAVGFVRDTSDWHD